MKTNTIPAIIMLAAGCVASVTGIMSGLDTADFLKTLLIVLVVFYIIGCIVKLVLDMILKTKDPAAEQKQPDEADNDTEAGEGEPEEAKQLKEETANDKGKNDVENANK
jgi:flagellar biosynthesis/type III secretory pathway M-ring protein FliF/YscJ